MKRIVFVILLIGTGIAANAQAVLRHIDTDSFRSDFLKAISRHPLEYKDTTAIPVYSYLTSKRPHLIWNCYGGIEFEKNYRLSIADGYPSWESNGVDFVTLAYTKGDFVLALCSMISYVDIGRDCLYTYDLNGNVIDSLEFYREFTAENGIFLQPLAGVLMGNLDVIICEVVWQGELPPYHPVYRTLIGGKQRGRRVDSYYSPDASGHFVLRKQVRYYPRTYTDKDITTLDLRDKDQHERKPVLKPRPADDIQEVVEY